VRHRQAVQRADRSGAHDGLVELRPRAACARSSSRTTIALRTGVDLTSRAGDRGLEQLAGADSSPRAQQPGELGGRAQQQVVSTVAA
jgi:hypothetical protein